MISLFSNILTPESISFSLFVIFFTAAIGLFLGNIKIFKVNIGIAGVLFSGILFSYFGFKVNEKILEFLREFGLILFVYAVGTQVGPGFLSSFKKEGMKLNTIATFIVIFGIVLTLIIINFFGISAPLAIGMYCGAVTNTPALAAAQQSMLGLNNQNINEISVGYALSYPGAIIGIILSIILIKVIFKMDSQSDMEKSLKINPSDIIDNANIKVENKNLDGIKIKDIPALDDLNIVVSRISKNGDIKLAKEEDIINIGDIILAVGLKKNLDEFVKIVGSFSEIDLRENPKITHSRVVVSRKNVIGKKLSEIKLYSYNVIATRVSRADVEFLITDDYTIQYGDNIVLVGDENDVKKAAVILGNSPKDLNNPNLIPVFIGIIVGIILGSIPFDIPGIGQSVKLGLAGGPLISAIFFSYIQNIGKLSWYMPPAGNLMIREIGIILFLSCVGLKSGESFFNMLFFGNGIKIAALSFLISFLPVFILGIFMKWKYKTNYLILSGAMAGSMTDPPALAFANSISPSNYPSMGYTCVYPWVMFLRIISAQLLVIFLTRI